MSACNANPRGPAAERVMTYLEGLAREGKAAPSQMDMAKDLGLSHLPAVIQAMTKAGRLEIRAHGGNGRLRSYRLPESGLCTAGFDEASVGEAVADRVFECISAIAARGGEMPGYAAFGEELGLTDRAVYDAVQKLCRDGRLEARSLGGRSRRAFRVVETGRATAGFSRGTPILTQDMQPRARKPEVEARDKAQTRNCISCRKPFMSEGIHNRMCASCRKGAGSMDISSHRMGNGRVGPQRFSNLR